MDSDDYRYFLWLIEDKADEIPPLDFLTLDELAHDPPALGDDGEILENLGSASV